MSSDLQFPPAPEALGSSGAPAPSPPPSREELLKRLREKTRRRPVANGSKNDSPTISSLVSQLSQYTKMDESVIKQMIQETGVKKMAKNPLKFAKKVAEALPAMKAFEK